MTSVMGVGNSRNPIGSRADGCNGNESSRTDPSDIGEGCERVFGRCCGRCFHWSRLFTTLIYARQQILKKCGEVAFFRGEVLAMAKGKTVNVQGGNGGKKKVGRPLKILSADVTKKAIEAARLGIPLERIAIGCGFWNNGAGWQSYLARNPAFAAELEQARFDGEVELSSVVRQCGNGWQGSAWLLERTRGYVARAQLDHTTKGKELSVSGSLLGAFGGGK